MIVGAALLIGGAVLWLLNRHAPHEHFIKARDSAQSQRLSQVWLFVIAITLHNLPEGLAVGVSFGGGDMAAGTQMAVAIGTQNMPEGLAVAAALIALDHARAQAVLIALGTGLVEAVGGLLGVAAAAWSEPLLPWGLGFAAGAMLFVINHEIVPETHRQGHESLATWGVLTGLVLMMLLDVTLG